jgi:multiple sugar transport system ATP-binding protein
MATIELRNVSATYGEQAVLRDFSLAVRKGEFLTLLGPSGCGKSTTLNLIAGLIEPTSGEVLIDGDRVNGTPPRLRRVAMVFQDYALYPHMTVFDNLAFPLRASDISEADIRARIERVATALGISHLTSRIPKELSGGQQQRVALGRALVRDPRAFLMDEPLSNLDARLRVAMRAELKRLHRQFATTTIYVTHDQAEAMTLSDRIAVLRDGVLQQVGTPRDVYQHPQNQFVASFVGALGMNFITCRLVRTQEGAFLARGAFRMPVTEAAAAALELSRVIECVVGLRPEHVRIVDPANSAMRGRIEVLEYLGAEIIVHLRIEDALLLVRTAGDLDLETEATVGVQVDRDHACMFDTATEGLMTTGAGRQHDTGAEQHAASLTG